MANERELEFLRFMSRHLVALTAEYKSYDDNGELHHHGVFALSGFVVEWLADWYWVTAGHCLKTLDEKLPTGQLRIQRMEFMDCFGVAPVDFHGIPFTYEPGSEFFIYDKSLALDFGLIRLSELYRQNMIANKVIPITRDHWERQVELDFQHYKILGFPAEEIVEDPERRGGAVGHIRPVMIVVDRLSPQEILDAPSDTWFIGRIPGDVQVSDIGGMSGGPIFGFRKLESGQWAYHIVALQSWWRPQSRVTFGCSLPRFAAAVQNAMELWKARSGAQG